MINAKKCIFCNTKSLYLIKNQRSDASFEYFVHCKKCNDWVGKIDWHGNFSFYKNVT